MSLFIASKVVKLLISNNHLVSGSRVLRLGVTLKENCPDIRNSKVVEIFRELKQNDIDVDIYDMYADPEEVMSEYGI